MSAFFRSSQYHIPTFEEMKQWNTEEELDNTLLFASEVQEYSKILKAPVLPEFICPKGMNPDEYLRQQCRDGWLEKVKNRIPKDKHDEYAKRVEHELQVLQGAGLSSYFLIVSDIINYVKNQGWLPGPGRGSAAWYWDKTWKASYPWMGEGKAGARDSRLSGLCVYHFHTLCEASCL